MPDMSHEDHFRSLGHSIVCGIDEAGRGPLAGPVCAAAVVLPEKFTCVGLNDSKKIKSAQRNALYHTLTTNPSVLWGYAIVEAAEIDAINILAATHKAMALAAAELQARFATTLNLCLIDGLPVPRFPLPSHAIVKGDSLSLSIAAASIIAKVTRDRIMLSHAQEFPHYGFERHMGYGTKQHLTALTTHGPCRIHRRSFQPVSQLTLPLD
jgi:ribonuclease HII